MKKTVKATKLLLLLILLFQLQDGFSQTCGWYFSPGNTYSRCTGEYIYLSGSFKVSADYYWINTETDDTVSTTYWMEAYPMDSIKYECHAVVTSGTCTGTYIATIQINVHSKPDLVINSIICLPSIDLTTVFTDNNGVDGTMRYSLDPTFMNSDISNPTSVTQSGKYYIRKETIYNCWDTVSVRITICTDIMDAKESNEIRISRDGSEYTLLTAGNSGEATITNLTGSTVKQFVITADKSEYALTNLKTGLYVVSINYSGRQKIFKLVVE